MAEKRRIGRPVGRGVSARVLRAMGLFGGVQGLGILCSVVRVKLVALWLGPAGVALFGIFNGAVEMVRSISQLGLRQSSVREIAQAKGKSSEGTVVTVVRRWGWILGLLGALLMVSAAPLLSRSTFGSDVHTFDYMMLGAALFCMALLSAEEAVMQGLERLRALARASLWGMVGGLAVSVPMYWFWGIESVVPSIIAYAVVTLGAVMANRVRGVGGGSAVTARQTLGLGQRFIVLGVYMTAADVVAQILNYVFIAWLNTTGGESEVGFYQAGFTIVNRYPGLVMSAIAVEYYPRLASVASSPMRTRLFVAHEMRLLMLVLTAFVALFVPFSQLAVEILYSSEFEVAVPFVTVAMIGVMLRGVAYCMSYSILARGDGHAFIITESADAVVGLLLNMGAYSLWGLGGLGVSYTLWYASYVVIVAVVYRRRYRLSIPRELVAGVVIEIAAVGGCVAVAMAWGNLWALIPAVAVASICLRSLMKLLNANRNQKG